MAEQEQSRSEPATPFKLAEAKKQGQVAKSPDFNTFIVVVTLLGVMVVGGERGATYIAGLCAWLFQVSGSVRLEQPGDASWLAPVLSAAMSVITPFAVIGLVCAILANLIQTGPIFSIVPLRPKFERVNPVAGFKRVFTKRILFEGFKTLLKLALLGTVLYLFFSALWPLLPTVATSDPGAQISWFALQGKALLFRLGLGLLVIGILDLVYVRWQFGQQMMMSRRELKEEIKRREGDPLIRAKLRELQRENLKQARSLSRVPEADVLITNPEHFAIALKYVRGEMSAPEVVAKGCDAWAVEMKSIAYQHGIPRYERRSLARHLFRRSQIGRVIPADAFVEVARVYADIDAQRRRLARYEVRK